MELAEEKPQFRSYANLFLLTYSFLLRLPSEALPLRAHSGDFNICCEGMFVLTLAVWEVSAYMLQLQECISLSRCSDAKTNQGGASWRELACAGK